MCSKHYLSTLINLNQFSFTPGHTCFGTVVLTIFIMSSKLHSEQKKSSSKSIANKNDASMKPSTSRSTTASSTSNTSNDHKIYEKCIAEGCNKSAVSHPEWDNEYCSVDCCYNHCKTTFEAWLTANKIANDQKIKTSSIQESVAGPSNLSVSTSIKS